MPVTFNERLIAYLALISGLLISAVAEYYSIVGLTAIFPTAFIPIVIMGIAFGVGKLVATVWLKQNWNIAPLTVKTYLMSAIFVLMAITSMGIFGFLSKSHSDQSLVSGDVISKIAIYDEKIKTAKENIEANRKQLKQMDEAVDQVMARSTSEEGATKANAIRKSQQRDRSALAKDIEANQKLIATLNDEAAPIRAEVRKVEAEVGPIKYIAAFIYGDTDPTILEKAVTWVIILLIIVFDPLAVILLLASQISFQDFREREDPNERELQEFADAFNEVFNDPYVADVGEKPTAEELEEIATEGNSPEKESDVISTATVTNLNDIEPAQFQWKGGFVAQEVAELFPEAVVQEEKSILEQHPYLNQPFKTFKNLSPVVYHPELDKMDDRSAVHKPAKEYVVDADLIDALEGTVNRLQQENTELHSELMNLKKEKLTAEVNIHGYSSEQGVVRIAGHEMPEEEFKSIMNWNSYVQNEEQAESGRWKQLNSKISEEEYIELAKKKKNDNSDNAS